jgi:hypothetical protein
MSAPLFEGCWGHPRVRRPDRTRAVQLGRGQGLPLGLDDEELHDCGGARVLGTCHRFRTPLLRTGPVTTPGAVLWDVILRTSGLTKDGRAAEPRGRLHRLRSHGRERGPRFAVLPPQSLSPASTRCACPGCAGGLWRVLGTPESDHGLDYFEEAVEVVARSPARLEHAKALVALGVALRHARRPTDARDPSPPRPRARRRVWGADSRRAGAIRAVRGGRASTHHRADRRLVAHAEQTADRGSRGPKIIRMVTSPKSSP